MHLMALNYHINEFIQNLVILMLAYIIKQGPPVLFSVLRLTDIMIPNQKVKWDGS